jgi:SNF2 family DNA or RNA helicase
MPLLCLEQLRSLWQAQGVELLPYQVEAAERIVEDMDGHGILADEVGLGKTIEAGLVARELMCRGRCRSVLVLCPAPLCRQWQREMASKFGLPFCCDPRPHDWVHRELIVASIDAAKRSPARELLLAREWDLVVVDEAHKLKNRATQNHRLVAALRRRHLLLLSATPLQNDLTELYALVSLVRPGLFGSFHAFWREFLLDRRTPKDPAALRAVLAKVMVRHRRHDLGRELGEVLPARQVVLLPLQLKPAERRLYDAVSGAVREEYWRRLEGEGTVLPLMTLQREVCSSAAAVRRTLYTIERSEWLGGDLEELRALADAVTEQAKAQVLQGLVAQIGERTLVFTEFRATQEYLAEQLGGLGVPVLLFHGEQAAWERERALRRFAAEPKAVLLSTECGGQGLNMQFCHHVVNYDLPWNPMKVEQRIGRVHRLGQEHDVYVYNLYAEKTVEEYLLRLLDDKINLFRQVIGELDVILRRLERGGRRSLESRVAEILWRARDERELAFRFEELGRELLWHRRLAREREAVLAAAGDAEAPGGAGAAGAPAGVPDPAGSGVPPGADEPVGVGTPELTEAPAV